MGFSSWIWPLHLSDGECESKGVFAPYGKEDIVIHDSPVYAEDCTPLFHAPDEYKWHCVGKWKVPGICRAVKGEDKKIHITCVQCFAKQENGRYDRIECPTQSVDGLLEVIGHELNR